MECLISSTDPSAYLALSEKFFAWDDLFIIANIKYLPFTNYCAIFNLTFVLLL